MMRAAVSDPEAREWARRTVSEYGFREQAEEILVRLYAPGLPEVVDDLDTVVRSTADRFYTGSRPRAALPEARGPRTVTDRLSQDLHRRVFVWCELLAGRRRAYYADDRDALRVDNLYRRTVRHLERRRTPWDCATVSLLLDAALLDLVHLPVPLEVCELADDEALKPNLDRLRDIRSQLREEMARNRSWRVHPKMDVRQVRTFQLLLRLGDTLSMADLFVEGDLFGTLLRDGHPDLFAHPGLGDLLAQCLVPTGTRPSKEWRRRTEELLAAVPHAERTIRRLLELTPSVPRARGEGSEAQPPYFRPHVHDILNGVVWCVELLPEESTPWAVPVLERLTVFAGTGPGGSKLLRSERMASAAARILAARGGDRAIAALARVRAKVRKKTLLATLDKALSAIAAQLGITDEELLERTVPAFGLDRDGGRTETLGEHPATLSLAADGTAALGFVSARGRPAASPPKPLRESHPERIKELRAELKELRRAVAAEHVRVEAFLSEGRTWTVEPWVRYYLDQPVTGTLARRLIWEVSSDAGRTWEAGLPEADGGHWRLAAPDGRAVAHTRDLSDTARIRLWHPVRHGPESVRRWRDHLTGREIAQPFKQAYREIYLLTPAEEAAGDHSLRFAAHILKYPQAKALLTARGWSAPALAGWSGGEEGTAERVYTDRATDTAWRVTWDLRMVDPDDLDDSGRARTSGTDRVRFHRGTGRETAVLTEVPALVLSEAMRDLDLAVGVASIAADPAWNEDAHAPYWRRTAFGELSENALVRRAALVGLVPRLRVRDRLEVRGRFLRVRGDLRTYRIHLGSANILMEPDDAYLCVVPCARDEAGVFLPFEDGGGRLSVILSKAFLLADDAAITDPGIATQIRRGLE